MTLSKLIPGNVKELGHIKAIIGKGSKANPLYEVIHKNYDA